MSQVVDISIKCILNTPETSGGPGGRDRTLAVTKNIGGNKFSVSGVCPKWVKSKRRREKKEERPKVGNNNG